MAWITSIRVLFKTTGNCIDILSWKCRCSFHNCGDNVWLIDCLMFHSTPVMSKASWNNYLSKTFYYLLLPCVKYLMIPATTSSKLFFAICVALLNASVSTLYVLSKLFNCVNFCPLIFYECQSILKNVRSGRTLINERKKNPPYSLVTGSTPEAPHHNDDKQTSRLSLLPAPSLLHCDANVPGSRLNRQGCPSLDSADKWDFWTFSSPCPKN